MNVAVEPDHKTRSSLHVRTRGGSCAAMRCWSWVTILARDPKSIGPLTMKLGAIMAAKALTSALSSASKYA